MKSKYRIIVPLLFAFLLALPLHAATVGDAAGVVKAVKAAWEKDQLTVLPFASVRLNDSDPDYGGGLAIGYALSKHSVIEAEAVSDGADSDDTLQTFLKDIGANLKLYHPLGKSGFAPYLIGGYRYNLDDSENQVAAGVGLEYRRGSFGIFADGRAIQALDQPFNEFGNLGIFRLGITAQF